MDKKLLEATNLCVEIINSKRQVKEKLGQSLGTNSCLLALNLCCPSYRNKRPGRLFDLGVLAGAFNR